jgi:NAD(P)H-dependent flavin oxidoreductase YrpB (nitropropane dioxygenase family)
MTIGGGVGALVDVSLNHPIRLIASALGPPPPELVTEAHNRGILVAALAGRKDHALRHQAIGVDIIVAQGYEAGGHTGEIATMVLVPEVVEAVSPTPVIAAGGIASGKQMAAAMALGAQGVWCGSVWLTTEEAETQPIVKDKFLQATSSDTLRSRSTTGKPARQLRSAWTDEWEDPDNPDPLPMPLQPMLIGEAQARIRRAAKPGNGAAQLANYYVGQVVGSLNQVKSTRQVVEEMVAEYVEVASKFADELQTLGS